MQCPSCSKDAGEAEFCPHCLARVAEPKVRGDEAEKAAERKALEDETQRKKKSLEESRKMFVYGGIVVVAISVGVAIAGIVGALTEKKDAPQSMEMTAPRIRCARDKDCGTDPCGRPVSCVEHVCTRTDLSPCPEK